MSTFKRVWTTGDVAMVRINDDGSETSFSKDHTAIMDELRAYCQSIGKTLVQWAALYPAPPGPTAAEQGLAALQAVAAEYAIAQMVANEFGDTTRLAAVQAKIATWKTAHPGVIP